MKIVKAFNFVIFYFFRKSLQFKWLNEHLHKLFVAKGGLEPPTSGL